MLEINNLYEGDCLEIMDHITSHSIDLVLCDPPYGTTKCKWDAIIPIKAMWQKLNKITKPLSRSVLFCQEPFTSLLVTSNLKGYRCKWTWKKDIAGNFITVNQAPLRYCEDILVFSKPGSKNNPVIYNPQFRSGTGVKQFLTKKFIRKKKAFISEIKDPRVRAANNTTHIKRYPCDILSYPIPKANRFHPTQKPVRLFEHLIKTYSNVGDTVLDFTAGSGVAGVACQNTKRNFIIIEKHKEYCIKIRKRLEENKKRLLALDITT